MILSLANQEELVTHRINDNDGALHSVNAPDKSRDRTLLLQFEIEPFLKQQKPPSEFTRGAMTEWQLVKGCGYTPVSRQVECSLRGEKSEF